MQRVKAESPFAAACRLLEDLRAWGFRVRIDDDGNTIWIGPGSRLPSTLSAQVRQLREELAMVLIAERDRKRK